MGLFALPFVINVTCENPLETNKTSKTNIEVTSIFNVTKQLECSKHTK